MLINSIEGPYSVLFLLPLSCAAVLVGPRWRGWTLVIVHELFNMLGAGDLLFISLTSWGLGSITFTAHPPAVFSTHLKSRRSQIHSQAFTQFQSALKLQ